MLPDPSQRPWLKVEEAGALFGFHRSKSYEEARRWVRTGGAEGVPTIRFGRTLRCPTAKVLDLLGISFQPPIAGAEPDDDVPDDDVAA